MLSGCCVRTWGNPHDGPYIPRFLQLWRFDRVCCRGHTDGRAGDGISGGSPDRGRERRNRYTSRRKYRGSGDSGGDSGGNIRRTGCGRCRIRSGRRRRGSGRAGGRGPGRAGRRGRARGSCPGRAGGRGSGTGGGSS